MSISNGSGGGGSGSGSCKNYKKNSVTFSETLDTDFNLSSNPSGGRTDDESGLLLTAKSSPSPIPMPIKYNHHGSATILDQIPENEQPTAGKPPHSNGNHSNGRRRSSVAMQEMLSTHRPSTIMSALRRGSLAWLPGRGKSGSSSHQGGHDDSNMGSKGSLSQVPHGSGGAHCELALESRRKNRRIGDDALSTALSALYAKVIVILGIALPVTEILSSQIPANVYQGFYLYLYSVSITFVIFVYASNMRRRAVMTLIKSYQEKTNTFPVKKRVPHFGSFYLRVGAIAFGIGTMVYSGLELGQYFELHASPGCHSIFVALTPAARMILSIVQMQFIFLNTSELDMARHKVFARFGLMHMIATNLCEWLYILVEETKHEIHHLAHMAEHPRVVSAMVNITHQILSTTTTTTTTALPTHSSEESSEEDFGGAFLLANGTARHSKRSPVDSTDLSEYIDCQRTNIMGSLVQNASPFLFPCTIEYSLICAVILYEMWKKVKTIAEIDRTRRTSHRLHSVVTNGHQGSHHHPTGKSAHHFSVDCSRAHRGMFGGIIITVLTIICLIMYFVLHDEPGYEYFALQEVTIAETLLYTVTAAAVVAAMIKMRDLKYCKKHNDAHASSVSLDCTLLVLAQTGVYVYGMFSIVGSYFSIQNNVPGAQEGMIAELFSLVQTSIQTLFILNAVWRKCRGAQQHRTKPGREIVTFLLVANMAMWFINTLIKGRASFRPSHLDFFGTWAWTVITHVSMPLAIFYRFHSTICLFEVWKATYKVKGGDHH
ncbi:proton channel OtopLc isoform X2 [Culex pipiens pallens]|uniref:proton channel OtopLc isoform X2 n=1 Tax=Culex pipiens pallens TaxID=42434 RepID=UPI0019536CA9|nr:proton channel OtopLc isoform X2 [Culex pipiens pallens]XP_052565616.1 proton channel OtopLc isoform X2 [Culex pipiens pallens]